MAANVEITKEKFEEFQNLRKEGAINMLSPVVREFTSLTIDEHRAIINNYSELSAKFSKKAKK